MLITAASYKNVDMLTYCVHQVTDDRNAATAEGEGDNMSHLK